MLEWWNHFQSNFQGVQLAAEGWQLIAAVFAVLILSAGWLYSRDTVEVGLFWKIWLTGLRLLGLAGLLFVALNPEKRVVKEEVDPSQFALLIDTSSSLSIVDSEKDKGLSRGAQVQQFLEKTKFVDDLRKTHNVQVYTFDSKLIRQQTLPRLTAEKSGSPAAAPEKVEWSKLLTSKGPETRLGESLMEVIRQEGGESLAGIAVVTDGGNNAGIDPLMVADKARTSKIRVFTIGVGSTAKPINLQLVDVQGPTHVHVGDGFSLSAIIAGQGMAGKPLSVELLSKKDGDPGEMTVLQEKETQLGDDGAAVTVSFDYTPKDAGKQLFRVRVKSRRPVKELIEDDNADDLPVTITAEKTKVLVIAGGPMRDYQFVRNLLHRDKAIELDVWLQTGAPGISQESDNLLFSFPQTREDLFKYDVVLLFDPNWDLIEGETKPDAKGQPENGCTRLAEWVFGHAGGLMFVAGDVYTPELAGMPPEHRPRRQKIFDMLPVVLDPNSGSFEDEVLNQSWPVEFTRDGLEAGFLQLTDSPTQSIAGWNEFQIYRCYPTRGVKAGTTVFAKFNNAEGIDPPVLLASQFYGSGRVLYLGSPEMWRLRSVEEDYYDRLWVRMLREIGQGRLLRGTNRGVVLLERKQFTLGSTVQVRARVLDPQFKEYVTSKLPLEVFLPNGKALVPAVELMPDKTRPGQYSSQFVAAASGTYNIRLPIPDSVDFANESFTVKQPNLEYDHPEQNETLLKLIARNADRGQYFTLETAAGLPQLLEDKTRTKTSFERSEPWWDKQWVIWFLVGVFGVEWLSRKLLKLA